MDLLAYAIIGMFTGLFLVQHGMVIMRVLFWTFLVIWLAVAFATMSKAAPSEEQAGVHIPPPMDKIWCEAVVGDGRDVRMGKCNKRFRMPVMPNRLPLSLEFSSPAKVWGLQDFYNPEPMEFPHGD